MRKHIIIIFVMLIVISGAVTSETILSSLDEIASYGAEHNVDYKNSQVNVMRAEDNRSGVFLLKNSSLSFNADIYGNPGSPSAEPSVNTDPGYSSSLTVPVIEQISLSASVDNNLNGQVGISLNPLSHSSEQKESELVYNNSVILAEGTMISVQIDAIGAALNWMLEKREMTAADKDSTLSEIMYRDDKVRYDKGEITLDQLQESLIAWSEARVLLATEEKQYKASESLLYSTLGGASGEVVVEMMELDTLEDALASLKNNLDPESGNPMKLSTYLISVLDMQSAEVNLKHTWKYEPDLKASAGLSIDSSGNLSVEAGIQFSISPDNFQKKKKNIAESEYIISRIESDQSLNQAELNFEQTIKSISSSDINSNISRLKMEQAEILLSEAEFLYKEGDYSELELNESQLTLVKAENSLFQALTEEYLSWLELKKYM